jgi:phosphate transport system protein
MTRTVDRDLDNLRSLIFTMGTKAEKILAKSLSALESGDSAICEQVQRDDLEIDRLDLAVDEAVLETLATQAPVARDLRAVIAAKAAATDLERIGDISRNIATAIQRIRVEGRIEIPRRLGELADGSQTILHQALSSYADENLERATQVLDQDDAIDACEASVVADLTSLIKEQPHSASRALQLILIAKNLERVADHATNIAEDVVQVIEARNLKHASKLHAQVRN